MEKDREREFYNYLRDKGFTDNGANEIIDRISKNRPDREDLYQLRSFENEENFIRKRRTR